MGWFELCFTLNIYSRFKSANLKVWLDINELGRQGLYADIAEGLKNCKLVVTFISDEYSKSENCLMELTHSIKNRKLPVIVCVVGEPNRLGWRHTQVGMLVALFELIPLQSLQDLNDRFDR
jgi:hypothetical protein